MTGLTWGSSFKRAYKKVVEANPDLKPKIIPSIRVIRQ